MSSSIAAIVALRVGCTELQTVERISRRRMVGHIGYDMFLRINCILFHLGTGCRV